MRKEIKKWEKFKKEKGDNVKVQKVVSMIIAISVMYGSLGLIE